MKIDWWTLALQAINVLVLIWLLGHFLYKPVLAAIATRRAVVDKLVNDAMAAKAEAEAERAELKARAAALAAEAGQRRDAVIAAAEVSARAVLKKADDEAAAKQARAEEALAHDRREAGEAAQRQAARLAASIAGRLLRRLSPEVVTEAMFQSLMERIAALSSADRGRIGEVGQVVEITTAAPLSPDEQADYQARLEAVLGRSITADFKVDAALIAGFELSAPDILVTNSWRADLAAVMRQLTQASATEAGHAD